MGDRVARRVDALHQQDRQALVEQHRKLEHARPQRHRHGEAEHLPDGGRPEAEGGAETEAEPAQHRQQHRELQHAGHEHREPEPVGERGLRGDQRVAVRRVAAEVQEARPDEHDGDVADVEDDRGGRRRAEAPVDLEHAAEERGGADQDDVRQHDRRELQCQDLVGAGVGEGDQREEDEFADDGDGDQDRDEQVHARRRERVGGGVAVGLERPRVERDERRRQRPLAEQPAEQVRHDERDGERRRDQPGAEVMPRHHLAHEAEQPAGEREQPDQLRVADERTRRPLGDRLGLGADGGGGDGNGLLGHPCLGACLSRRRQVKAFSRHVQRPARRAGTTVPPTVRHGVKHHRDARREHRAASGDRLIVVRARDSTRVVLGQCSIGASHS